MDGLAALLVSTLPVWLILLDWLWAGGPRPTGTALAGIGLGILGTLILVDPVRLAGSSIHLPGAAMVVLASVLSFVAHLGLMGPLAQAFSALIAMVTHAGPEQAINDTIDALANSDSLLAEPMVMHILGA
jgi:drug/metabolite transporter (DMT)-like permease